MCHSRSDSALVTINNSIPLCVSHIGLRFNDIPVYSLRKFLKNSKKSIPFLFNFLKDYDLENIYAEAFT